MIYKNNYQRKQAVWREKWMKKVEERQRVKALYQPVIAAGVSLRKAIIDLEDDVSEIIKKISNGISEVMEIVKNDPELAKKLRKAKQKETL